MLSQNKIRDFSKLGEVIPVPDLADVQLRSYEEFVQSEVSPSQREPKGLEGLFREVWIEKDQVLLNGIIYQSFSQCGV